MWSGRKGKKKSEWVKNLAPGKELKKKEGGPHEWTPVIVSEWSETQIGCPSLEVLYEEDLTLAWLQDHWD